jgi:hypothetical protein
MKARGEERRAVARSSYAEHVDDSRGMQRVEAKCARDGA